MQVPGGTMEKIDVLYNLELAKNSLNIMMSRDDIIGLKKSLESQLYNIDIYPNKPILSVPSGNKMTAMNLQYSEEGLIDIIGEVAGSIKKGFTIVSHTVGNWHKNLSKGNMMLTVVLQQINDSIKSMERSTPKKKLNSWSLLKNIKFDGQLDAKQVIKMCDEFNAILSVCASMENNLLETISKAPYTEPKDINREINIFKTLTSQLKMKSESISDEDTYQAHLQYSLELAPQNRIFRVIFPKNYTNRVLQLSVDFRSQKLEDDEDTFKVFTKNEVQAIYRKLKEVNSNISKVIKNTNYSKAKEKLRDAQNDILQMGNTKGGDLVKSNQTLVKAFDNLYFIMNYDIPVVITAAAELLGILTQTCLEEYRK
jgi:hypothetical protein